MVDLFLRVDVAGRGRIGPGKIRLLEQIARTGSISAAGRAMGMSYRRAWVLVDELNGLFSSPVVTTQTGGIHGGGAALTPLARDLVARYRSLEIAATSIAVDHLAILEGLVVPAVDH